MALAEDMLDDAGRDATRRSDGGLRGVGPRRAQARGDARVRHRADSSTRSTSTTGRRTRSATRSGSAIKSSYDEKEAAGRPRGAAARRARHHAADRRRAVEGPPLQPRPPEGRHRPARLRPARSAGRVQERKLRALPGDEGRVDEEIVRYLWWLRPVLNEEARGAGRRGVPAPRRAPLILNDPGGGVDVASSAARRARRRPSRPARSAAAPTSSRRASAATTRSQDGAARRAEGRPQRSVPVRQRQEIQEVPRRRGMSGLSRSMARPMELKTDRDLWPSTSAPTSPPP